MLGSTIHYIAVHICLTVRTVCLLRLALPWWRCLPCRTLLASPQGACLATPSLPHHGVLTPCLPYRMVLALPHLALPHGACLAVWCLPCHRLLTPCFPHHMPVVLALPHLALPHGACPAMWCLPCHRMLAFPQSASHLACYAMGCLPCHTMLAMQCLPFLACYRYTHFVHISHPP